MVADDELDLGVLCGNDLAYALGPDRAMQSADALHLEHQFILRERGILRPQPLQALWCTNLLDINILKESFELPMPLADVRSCESADGLRAFGVHVAKQAPFDLIIDECAEEG
jgi:hypothetical protein